MSLVVWDGKVLAADTGTWGGDLRWTAAKLSAATSPALAVATVGGASVGQQFRELVLAGRTIPKDFNFAGCSAITVRRLSDGTHEVMYYEDSSAGVRMPASRPLYLGNAAAVAAAVALVEIEKHPAHVALGKMLFSQRYDAVWGTVDYWTEGELHHE